jgi:hypothetical protein
MHRSGERRKVRGKAVGGTDGFAFVPQSYRVPVPSHAASTGREKHTANAVALNPLLLTAQTRASEEGSAEENRRC